jgi:hypothetical protein
MGAVFNSKFKIQNSKWEHGSVCEWDASLQTAVSSRTKRGTKRLRSLVAHAARHQTD